MEMVSSWKTFSYSCPCSPHVDRRLTDRVKRARFSTRLEPSSCQAHATRLRERRVLTHASIQVIAITLDFSMWLCVELRIPTC
jgi:hypothetical protein